MIIEIGYNGLMREIIQIFHPHYSKYPLSFIFNYMKYSYYLPMLPGAKCCAQLHRIARSQARCYQGEENQVRQGDPPEGDPPPRRRFR